MVMDICKKLELDQNTDLATRAVTSVRYWVAHKSWRLRDHFKYLGTFKSFPSISLLPSYTVIDTLHFSHIRFLGHFILVVLILANRLIGQRYKAQQKAQHRNEDWSNALPPVSVV